MADGVFLLSKHGTKIVERVGLSHWVCLIMPNKLYYIKQLGGSNGER